MTALTEGLIARIETEVRAWESTRDDGSSGLAFEGLLTEAAQALRALQQEVARLRGSVHVLEATGSTLDDMREHCRSSKTYKLGDTVLCWVNEGDLYSPAVALEARSALTGSAQG